MPIRAISFDCANTLVQVDYDPVRFAVDCMRAAGVSPPLDAPQAYAEVFRANYPDFLAANQRNDPAALADVYRRINEVWLTRLDLDIACGEAILEAGDEIAFGAGSTFFSLFPDATPALKQLTSAGYRLVVISNWDLTLPRVLEMLGIGPFFEFSLASLVEGVEKPDPRLFKIGVKRLGLDPIEILHVGDNEIDDRDGAIAAGLRWSLLDRSAPPDLPLRIASLKQVLEVAQWNS